MKTKTKGSFWFSTRFPRIIVIRPARKTVYIGVVSHGALPENWSLTTGGGGVTMLGIIYNDFKGTPICNNPLENNEHSKIDITNLVFEPD